MHVCMHELCAPHVNRHPGRPEGVSFPGTGTTGPCEMSDVSAGYQTGFPPEQ